MIHNEKNIKNIIFDLGGVLLNVNYDLCIAAFLKLGLDGFDAFYSKTRQNRLFDRFEEGKISPADFRNEIRKFLPPNVSDAQIDDAWNVMLLDFPEERVTLLMNMKKNHRIFLLSNTNEIHITKFSEILKRSFGWQDLSAVFEKAYFSHQIKMRKPHEKVFELVLKENNLIAEETLFIDDSPQHVEGAANKGIYALLLEKGKTIMDLF